MRRWTCPRCERNERILAARLHSGLERIDAITTYELWRNQGDRVGVASFNLAGYRHCELAQKLSDEYAIGVRHGCFCAHPLLTRLLGVSEDEARRLQAELRAGRDPELPGAVRASLGIGHHATTTIDRAARRADRLPDALRRGGHVDVAHAQVRERVDDGVPDGRGRADRARFADALGAERVARRRRLRALGLEGRQVAGATGSRRRPASP